MVDVGILSEDEPLELVDGELIVVPPQSPPHANLTALLADRLRATYGDGYVVRVASPLVARPDSLPEPDVAVFHGGYADFSARHPRGDEAALVVEVARTSVRIDRKKAAAYARAGVATYWLIDLVNLRVEVHTEPHVDGRYALVRVLAPEDEIELPYTAVKWPAARLLPG
ncbi:MAG: Uma2 family endonuclease [Polyangiaceae bacterium]